MPICHLVSLYFYYFVGRMWSLMQNDDRAKNMVYQYGLCFRILKHTHTFIDY